MRASLGSHDTGEDYQLGQMRCLRIESMRLRNSTMRRDIRFFDSIVNLCLRRLSSQHDCFDFRMYSVVSRNSQPEGLPAWRFLYSTHLGADRELLRRSMSRCEAFKNWRLGVFYGSWRECHPRK
jgi:hypothetical protein